MVPGYHFARARRAAVSAWRLRPLKLSIPLLILCGTSGRCEPPEPMFAIAGGTRNSMFRASWKFTAGSRWWFVLLSSLEVLLVMLPSVARQWGMRALDEHAWAVLWVELALGCVIAFGRSWCVVFYTMLAWQVSGFDPETQASAEKAEIAPGEYGVPGLRL